MSVSLVWRTYESHDNLAMHLYVYWRTELKSTCSFMYALFKNVLKIHCVNVHTNAQIMRLVPYYAIELQPQSSSVSNELTMTWCCEEPHTIIESLSQHWQVFWAAFVCNRTNDPSPYRHRKEDGDGGRTLGPVGAAATVHCLLPTKQHIFSIINTHVRNH